MHGHLPVAVAPLDPQNWQASETYRYAIDLFNHGYYWEAHESWESLWHAAGRRGPIATWLKALIKLAAAAVKLREGNARGATRHAQRALHLLNEFTTQAANNPDQAWSGLNQMPESPYCGIHTSNVTKTAHAITEEAAAGTLAPNPTRLLDERLELQAK
jgi:hypothetical protein